MISTASLPLPPCTPYPRKPTGSQGKADGALGGVEAGLRALESSTSQGRKANLKQRCVRSRRWWWQCRVLGSAV